MDLLNSHITLSFDRYFMKIYRMDGYFVIAQMGGEFDICKTKKIMEVVSQIIKNIKCMPEIDLLFHYNKFAISKNKKIKLNKLIKDTQEKLITNDILKKYIQLLW
jgi:hypothetical protein